ncbi:MAG TPA: recombinase RecT [Balneolaceae bacterium]|nr:recombinase RecT [Balneolaceae bacterium]
MATRQLQKYSPKQFFRTGSVQKKFQELLGKKAQGFITSILQTISDSQMLAEADVNSVYNAAMTAAVLDLPINPNLGFAYIIPYRVKNKGVVAQFQMGYKGYIQLCQRSGRFKTISATPIYKGQVIEENPLTGFKFNFNARESNEVVGYAAYFSLINGFEKTLYMTMDEIIAHAKEYSQSYQKGFGPWRDNFEAMAIKTVIKLLLSKYAPMTIEMQALQEALTHDQAVIGDNAEVGYVDNNNSAPEQPEERERLDFSDQAEVTREDLMADISNTAKELYGDKWYQTLKKKVVDINDEAENMLSLSDEELGFLHTEVMQEAR